MTPFFSSSKELRMADNIVPFKKSFKDIGEAISLIESDIKRYVTAYTETGVTTYNTLAVKLVGGVQLLIEYSVFENEGDDETEEPESDEPYWINTGASLYFWTMFSSKIDPAVAATISYIYSKIGLIYEPLCTSSVMCEDDGDILDYTLDFWVSDNINVSITAELI